MYDCVGCYDIVHTSLFLVLYGHLMCVPSLLLSDELVLHLRAKTQYHNMYIRISTIHTSST